MIDELNLVVLMHDLPEYGLQAGDVGVVVHVYKGQKAFEVEFVGGAGETVAVVTLRQDEVRPLAKGELLHVRSLAAA